MKLERNLVETKHVGPILGKAIETKTGAHYTDYEIPAQLNDAQELFRAAIRP